jgi:hypothetical protein
LAGRLAQIQKCVCHFADKVAHGKPLQPRESHVEETVIDIAGSSNKLPSPNQKAFQAFFRGRILPDGSPDSTRRQLFLEVFAKTDWNCGTISVPLQCGH